VSYKRHVLTAQSELFNMEKTTNLEPVVLSRVCNTYCLITESKWGSVASARLFQIWNHEAFSSDLSTTCAYATDGVHPTQISA
jgi:hypothetical protein